MAQHKTEQSRPGFQQSLGIFRSTKSFFIQAHGICPQFDEICYKSDSMLNKIIFQEQFLKVVLTVTCVYGTNAQQYNVKILTILKPYQKIYDWYFTFTK